MSTLGMVCCDVDSSYFSLKCEPNSQFEPRSYFSLKCEPDLHSKGGGSDAGIPLQVFSERFRGPDLQEIEEGKEIGEGEVGEGEETSFGGVKGGEAFSRGHGELSPDAHQMQSLHSLGGWALKSRQLYLLPRSDISSKKKRVI